MVFFGPLSPLQGAVRANQAQIAANSETIKRLQDDEARHLLGEAAVLQPGGSAPPQTGHRDPRRRWLPWRRSRRAEPQDATPAAPARIKNDRTRHDWQIAGTSPHPNAPEFTLTDAACSRCGETAQFTALIDQFLLLRAWGCAREGFTGRLERYDLVVVDGRLDYFLNYLPDGKCATGNAGGGTYVQDVADLEPKTL